VIGYADQHDWRARAPETTLDATHDSLLIGLAAAELRLGSS
jgi:hypothetical protein